MLMMGNHFPCSYSLFTGPRHELQYLFQENLANHRFSQPWLEYEDTNYNA